jgi:hypothetical protein
MSGPALVVSFSPKRRYGVLHTLQRISGRITILKYEIERIIHQFQHTGALETAVMRSLESSSHPAISHMRDTQK